MLKYVKLFEENEDELEDKKILDRLIFLWRADVIDLHELDFEEGVGWDLVLKTDFGDVGFWWDEIEDYEYDGDGYDAIVAYKRKIGDTLYWCTASATARGHHDDLEVDELSYIRNIGKHKITK